MLRRPSLRHKVTVQRRGATRDFTESTTGEAWVDVATVWAEVLPIRGRELVNARQIMGAITHKVTTRYVRCFFDRTGEMTSQWRLKFDDCLRGENFERILNIMEGPIDVEERHQWLEMMCTEVTFGASQLTAT